MELSISTRNIFLLLILQFTKQTFAVDETGHNNIPSDFISKCLEQTNMKENNNCEDTRFLILDYYYTCKIVNTFDSPLKRISKENDRILVAIESKTFHVANAFEESKEVNIIISPAGEILDKYNNRYYTGDGTTYVVGAQDGKETEIVTSGNFALNEIALSVENDQLFILSFDIDNNGKRSGSLYVMKTNEIIQTDKNGKIKAQKIEDFGENFTAIFISKDSTSVFLGVSDADTGKLLKLKQNKFDPCTPGMRNRTYFRNIIKSATEELSKIFDEAMKHNTNPVLLRTSLGDETELNKLRTKNMVLENKVKRLESVVKSCAIRTYKTSPSDKLRTTKDQCSKMNKVSNGVTESYMQEMSCSKENKHVEEIIFSPTNLIQEIDTMDEISNSLSAIFNTEEDILTPLHYNFDYRSEVDGKDEMIYDVNTNEVDEEYLKKNNVETHTF